MAIPAYVMEIISKLEEHGHEAYIVGGCVRDLIMEKPPKDWDITTNAKPEEILETLPDGKYENVFGTVLVPIKKENGETEDVVEVTTYRSEQGYSDSRHPDKVMFEDSLEKDLARRDFTINAMAMKELRITNYELRINTSREIVINNKKQLLIDLFGGEKDIGKKIIRAVGEPEDRFKEDALRMMRAVRLACQLGFKIEEKTQRAIKKIAGGIKFVSGERIRDELIKILESDKAYDGVILLHDLKILQYVLPELEQGVGVEQNKHHIYTVFKHSVLSLKYTPSKDWRVRFASLLHDIAKPATKRLVDGDATFYNHDMVGAKIAAKIMRRLKFSGADTDKVTALIRYHMFYYNVGEVTESSVRRLLAKVGRENIKDLIDLRVADRLGSGVAKAKPYKLRHLEYIVKKVQHDPISVKMLALDGNDVMKELRLEAGPKIGAILDCLLAEVIESPALNKKECLIKRGGELKDLDLEELRAKAKEKITEKKMEDDRELKSEFYV